MRAAAFALALLLTGTALAGCLQEGATLDNTALGAPLPTSGFDTSRGWSTPLSPALYEVLPGVETLVESFDGTPISVAYFLPDMEGCDWAAAELPEECKVPVVMDAGPYYAGVVDQVKYRPPLIEWLVPRGYAVAHMSVRGTGESGGCMELFSENEQKDVSEVVTWLAEQPWSTGSVGMMGRSYDGTTPFMAAAQGNPHLKTIVPISGVPSLRDLMFKNGTTEGRGAIFHSVVYWANYGMGAGDGGLGAHRTPHAQEQACQAFVEGAIKGPLAAATGDTSDAYWEERDLRQKTLDNYNGSIWIIHGLEDWNVNPSQVIPFYEELEAKGLKTKLWLGVWGHAYPDRMDEHRNVRWDWAEHVVRWFDSELKGLPVDTGPKVEVEDSLFVWRAEETYPPRDLNWTAVDFGYTGTDTMTSQGSLGVQTEPLEAGMRIAGLPRFHATFTPTSPVATHVFAEMYDVFPDGRAVRIGWAAMNLQYHAGGNMEPATLTPGQPVLALMEFEPMDAHVAQGHRLRLNVHMAGVEDIQPSPYPGPVSLDWSASTLLLPLIERPALLPSYVPAGLGGDA